MGIKVAGIASVDTNEPNEKRISTRKTKKKRKENYGQERQQAQDRPRGCRCRRASTLPSSNTGFSIGTPQVNHSITRKKSAMNRPKIQMTGTDLLREDIDHTPTQTLMADATNALLGDSDVASPRASATNSLAKSELGLDLHIPCLAQVCHDARFIENRVCSAHAALEIEFEFLHSLCVRYEFQCGISWEARAVLG